jgi:hypothetical protein
MMSELIVVVLPRILAIQCCFGAENDTLPAIFYGISVQAGFVTFSLSKNHVK